MRPILKPGDEFATKNPMALGVAINIVQKAKSVDNESTYTHAGIITGAAGTTLESLWTVKSQNIWVAYEGKKTLIVRNINMHSDVYAAGYAKIKKHIGQGYPFPRLFLHLLHCAKWVHWDHVVCSELAAKFEAGCSEYLDDKLPGNTGFMRNWYGVNPDDLADRWRISRYYEIVFEGIA
ncbi:MAG: hypothetical protein Q8M56_09945 [Desulfobacterales bacterium]|nr:hypothetical protein [Desulfobacterales bacterium]